MSVLTNLSLRAERRIRSIRALRKGLSLRSVANRVSAAPKDAVLLCAVMRNERIRLPFFLEHYRRLGVGHFLFIDNDSGDGSAAFAAEQPDASVWRVRSSYRRAHFGMDWVNAILGRHAKGRWVVTVDLDELLVYPHHDTRPLPALTAHLDGCGHPSMSAMLIDLYSDRPVVETVYAEGEDPVEVAPYFDGRNYLFHRDGRYRNIWIQGGVRMRTAFADRPRAAPALNKIPLVKWGWGQVYASSTHSLLPPRLNRVYDETGGERLSGALLHTKFLNLLAGKTEEALTREQHYAGGREYRAYQEMLSLGALHTPASQRYDGWARLVELGLMSKGAWL